jgi:hypothetical protein
MAYPEGGSRLFLKNAAVTDLGGSITQATSQNKPMNPPIATAGAGAYLGVAQ